MIRTQISFDEAQFESLQERARAEGVSMAAFVRRAVDRAMQEVDRSTRSRLALSAIGRLHGGPADLGSDHDRYLDDAYSA
ncbi:MAG TPA: CopG family transcriptional regulator [Candidatus Limnocylindria bacterium]|nr:CopG family transcriptional regulator [Candidatus Limnocylindria bacterium]